jgi:hypothetical protein
MSYSAFKFSDLRQKFGIQEERGILFETIKPVQPTDWLKKTLNINSRMPMLSEKSKSELIVSPILVDIWEQNKECFTIFSGVSLDVDTDKGLNGECDFIFCSEPRKVFMLTSPIFTIVEAKNDIIAGGIPQCIAQMLGAKIFNEKEGKPISCIYGCVTTGKDWQFLKLTNNIVTIHEEEHYLTKLEELLGFLQCIIDSSK